MKAYIIKPLPDFNACIEVDPRTIVTWLEEATVGSEFKIKVIEMSKDEYEALPEYTGP